MRTSLGRCSSATRCSKHRIARGSKNTTAARAPLNFLSRRHVATSEPKTKNLVRPSKQVTFLEQFKWIPATAAGSPCIGPIRGALCAVLLAAVLIECAGDGRHWAE